MSEWGKLIRQKAAKGGCLGPEEQRAIREEAAIELGMRLQRRRKYRIDKAMSDFVTAARNAFLGTRS